MKLKIPKDKILHASVCLAASLGVFLATWPIFDDFAASLFSGEAFALGLALGKEYGDRENPSNKWSWGDIAADLVGMALCAAIAFALRYSAVLP